MKAIIITEVITKEFDVPDHATQFSIKTEPSLHWSKGGLPQIKKGRLLQMKVEHFNLINLRSEKGGLKRGISDLASLRLSRVGLSPNDFYREKLRAEDNWTIACHNGKEVTQLIKVIAQLKAETLRQHLGRVLCGIPLISWTLGFILK